MFANLNPESNSLDTLKIQVLTRVTAYNKLIWDIMGHSQPNITTATKTSDSKPIYSAIY